MKILLFWEYKSNKSEAGISPKNELEKKTKHWKMYKDCSI